MRINAVFEYTKAFGYNKTIRTFGDLKIYAISPVFVFFMRNFQTPLLAKIKCTESYLC